MHDTTNKFFAGYLRLAMVSLDGGQWTASSIAHSILLSVIT